MTSDPANDAVELRLMGWPRADICRQLGIPLGQLLQILQACPGLHTVLGVTVHPPRRQRAAWLAERAREQGDSAKRSFRGRMMRLGKARNLTP